MRMKKITVFFLLFLVSNLLSAQNDSIVLRNNNKLVGEIKGLDKSVLTLKTPFSDKDFKIKWSHIKEIYSSRLFIISLTNGTRINANINTNHSKVNAVLLKSEGYTLETELKKIIFLDPIGKSFLSRITAEFDMGIILTKANNSKQFTANAQVGFTANKWSLTGSFSSVLSSQDDVDDIKRIEGNVNFQRLLPNYWFLSTSTNFLSNNEQKLKLRSTGKAGGGYFFKHNNSLYFGAGSGLAFNNETYTDESIPNKNSLEVYLGTEFNKYDIGDLSLMTSLIAFPSITEKGRFRADFKFDMKYDLPLDFYIKMGITYNYDNQPATGASEVDYVFQTSFGWELD